MNLFREKIFFLKYRMFYIKPDETHLNFQANFWRDFLYFNFSRVVRAGVLHGIEQGPFGVVVKPWT